MKMVTSYNDENNIYYRYTNYASEVVPNVAGRTTVVYLPVDIPIQVFGVEQKLVSVQVTYKVASSSSYITDTRASNWTNTGVLITNIVDFTDRTNNTWTTYTITDTSPDTIDGSLFILFTLNFSGTGTNHMISFGRITATFTEN